MPNHRDKPSTITRVWKDDHARLRIVAAQRQQTMVEVLHQALAEYETNHPTA